MRAKKIEFEVTYVDLRNKPDWFMKISPHGKVPVLQVDEKPLFESNAIAEYLEEVLTPHLHPTDPIKRARNRAWTEFVPTFAAGLSSLYYTKTTEGADKRAATARQRLDRVEQAIASERDNDGPYFNGTELSLVDAAYAPFLQRFLIVERWLKSGLLNDYPLVNAWAEALLSNDTVTGSVPDNFVDQFVGNLQRGGLHIATLIDNTPA